MNRLKNYLQARQLAELHLNSAEVFLAKGAAETSVANLIKGVRYLMTANNNLQSLAFEGKRRTSKR